MFSVWLQSRCNVFVIFLSHVDLALRCITVFISLVIKNKRRPLAGNFFRLTDKHDIAMPSSTLTKSRNLKKQHGTRLCLIQTSLHLGSSCLEDDVQHWLRLVPTLALPLIANRNVAPQLRRWNLVPLLPSLSSRLPFSRDCFSSSCCVPHSFFFGCKGVHVVRRCVQRKHGDANSVETHEKLTTRHGAS